MSPRQKRVPLPRYEGPSRPAHLRTAEELHAEGLRPVPATPVALWHVVTPTRRSTSGLFDRRTAVPLEAKANAEME